MRYLSLFSGIEAASVAWHPLGWECVGVAEIEPFPSKVLRHHYPNVRNLGDVTKLTEMDVADIGPIDVVVFGSPCQDLSVAGKRKGLAGARSGLFFTAMQIITWSRLWCGTRFALWENVPGAFSSNKGADFAAVVDELSGLAGTEPPPKGWGTEGCTAGPEAMVEWSTLDAQWFGVAQRRRRVFALADFGNWAGRQPILLEPQSMRGDTAPRREAGQVAPTIPARSLGGGGLGTDFDCDGGVIQAFGGNNQSGPIDVATARSACASATGRLDFESETFLVQATAHTLRGEGFDASEDGTGRGTPLVPVSFANTAPTLKRDYGKGYGGGLVAFDTTQITSKVNRSNPQPGDPCHPLAAGAHPPAIAFSAKDYGADATTELAPTLRAMGHTDSHAQPDQMQFDPNTSASLTCSQYPAVAIEVCPTLRAGGNKTGGDRPPGTDVDTADSLIAYTTKLHNTASNQAGKLYEEYATSLDRSSPPPALLAAGAHPPAIAFNSNAQPDEMKFDEHVSAQLTCSQYPAVAVSLRGREGGGTAELGGAVQNCLRASGGGGDKPHVLTGMRVRRLTPRECERLQGFPDDYTLLPGKAPDGPRYKALGNSMAVPVMRWIGRQIDTALLFQE